MSTSLSVLSYSCTILTVGFELYIVSRPEAEAVAELPGSQLALPSVQNTQVAARARAEGSAAWQA